MQKESKMQVKGMPFPPVPGGEDLGGDTRCGYWHDQKNNKMKG